MVFYFHCFKMPCLYLHLIRSLNIWPVSCNKIICLVYLLPDKSAGNPSSRLQRNKLIFVLISHTLTRKQTLAIQLAAQDTMCHGRNIIHHTGVNIFQPADHSHTTSYMTEGEKSWAKPCAFDQKSTKRNISSVKLCPLVLEVNLQPSEHFHSLLLSRVLSLTVKNSNKKKTCGNLGRDR